MRRIDWALAGVAVLLAAGLYAMTGRPGMADMPMAEREAEIAAKSPDEMTPDEALARLLVLTRERPGDPEPHFFIGRMLAQQGRLDDAVRAYQSAIRRDERFAPAWAALGDTFVQMSGGEIAPETQRVYARAFQLDPGQLRAGFLVGLAEWRAGRAAQAEASWAAVLDTLQTGTSERAMVEAWIESAKNQPAAD